MDCSSSRRCGSRYLQVLGRTTHGARRDDALQGPQNDPQQQQHEEYEEHQTLPVHQPFHKPKSRSSLGRRYGALSTSPNIDTDAECWHAWNIYWSLLVAKPLPVHPHRLLLLLVDGEATQHLLAGGQSRRPLLWDGSGLAAEGAGDFRVLGVHGGGHDAGEALEAEGVSAVQLFWRFEDVVVGVEADGALGMRAHSLQVCF